MNRRQSERFSCGLCCPSAKADLLRAGQVVVDFSTQRSGST